MSDNRPLADRILDCFPGGLYALNALLKVLDIVASEEVETAAVECRLQPRLLVNPHFVERWARTPEKLLMLVLHELHHILLGHTRLLPRVTPLDNLVFDAVINALLCRMFPAPEYTSLFTDFYEEGNFPACLLRPPPDWDPNSRNMPPLPAGLKTPALRPVHPVYRALYSRCGVGYQELYGVLRRCVKGVLLHAVGTAPLLGDHSEEGDDDNNSPEGASSGGRLGERSPVLFEVVREIVERWPQPPDPIAGRSLADLLREEGVQPRWRPSNRAILRGLLRRVGGDDDRDGRRRIVRAEPSGILTPLPVLDRRAVVLHALGAPPLLYNGTIDARRRGPSGERVHVYLDVSGSIGNLKDALYGAVHDCRDAVHARVHLFSTEVVDVTLAELRQGKCTTTGGTSVECIAEHVQAQRVRRAVLITDGYVGRPAGRHREALAGVRLGVALAPGNTMRSDLEEVADHWAQLS